MSNSSPLSILIIEDDGNTSFSLKLAMEKRFTVAQIRIAVNMTMALIEIQKVKPNIILLDLHLTDSTPLNTIQNIKEISGNAAEIPVIILTGSDDPTLRELGLKKGASDYFIKGDYSIDRLIHSIEVALTGAATNIQLRQGLSELRENKEQMLELQMGVLDRLDDKLETNTAQTIANNVRIERVEKAVEVLPALQTAVVLHTDILIRIEKVIGENKMSRNQIIIAIVAAIGMIAAAAITAYYTIKK